MGIQRTGIVIDTASMSGMTKEKKIIHIWISLTPPPLMHLVDAKDLNYTVHKSKSYKSFAQKLVKYFSEEVLWNPGNEDLIER